MSNKVTYVYVARDLYSKVAEKVARVTEKVRSTVTKTMPVMKNFTGVALRGAGKGAIFLTKGLLQAGKQITLFSLAAAGAGLLVANRFVSAARDAEETASKFAVVFKDVTAQADQVAANLAKNYGLASTKSQQLLSDTGDLLTGFGFTGKAALDISEKVQQLSVDLASFTNFSGGAEGASQALTKALLGERESVKSLGISILEEDVKRKIQILRAQGMRFETMRQAKAYATLAIAQEQSKNAIGDYARTSDGLANKQRLLSQRTLDLSVKIGKLLTPVWSKLADIALKVIDKLTMKVDTLGTGITDKLIVAVTELEPLFLKMADSMIAMVDIATILAKAFKIVFQVLDKVGTTIGNVAGAVATGSFGELLSFFGLGGGETNINARSENIIKGGKTRADVNVNLKAPEGSVESVKSKVSGKAPGLNLGLNMAKAL